MSAKDIKNPSDLTSCSNCKKNLSVLLCKDCNATFCKKCHELLHKSENAFELFKTHSPPSDLIIPFETIKSLNKFNNRIHYQGKFRDGFHNPNDPPNYCSLPIGEHKTILCDNKLEPNKIYEIKFKIRQGYEDKNGSWTMFGIATDNLHGKMWSGNSGWFFNGYNSQLFTEDNENNKYCYNARRLQPGDEICIIVDMRRAEMLVEVNGVSLGVAFNHIPLGVDIYPAISPYGKSEEIELL